MDPGAAFALATLGFFAFYLLGQILALPAGKGHAGDSTGQSHLHEERRYKHKGTQTIRSPGRRDRMLRIVAPENEKLRMVR